MKLVEHISDPSFNPFRRPLLLALLLATLVGYWFIPDDKQVWIVPENWNQVNTWPMVQVEPRPSPTGKAELILVTDTVPWVYVSLTVDGRQARLDHVERKGTSDLWVWYWSFTAPDTPNYEIAFYHDCDKGCIQRARVTAGTVVDAPDSASAYVFTKLGMFFASPQRDWHQRSGWDVELTYAHLADQGYWGIDDLAERVQIEAAKGLRVLVRVDYDEVQSLPPAEDYLGLDLYLGYLRRLARDQRLHNVFGYIIGSDFNARGSNLLAPEHPVTPEWYARLFNGYGTNPLHVDNAVRVIRSENPSVRVLVGPVRPWTEDQRGEAAYTIDVPWLSYMNSLAKALSTAAAANAAAGVPLTAPDGFAVSAAGRPEAPELGERPKNDEPRIDLRRASWQGAQAGFRIYRDWLDVINAYPYLRDLPVYITATNTFTPDTNIPPAQNYPSGWLSTALEVINREPQVQALCWFMDDFPSATQWDLFRLSRPHGLLLNAADEFDQLLHIQP